MGSHDPKIQYRKAREKLSDSDLHESDKDAIETFLDGINPHCLTEGDRGNETKEYSTLKTYGNKLRQLSEKAETPLVEMSIDDFNALMDGLSTGAHPNVKEGGYAKSSLRIFQFAATMFYRFHSDTFDGNPEKITFAERPDKKVDERDMFDKAEIEAMRNAITNSRDRALFNLLLYTGQRVRAIQTLRIKDIDTEEGVFWLNDDAEGHKGASGKRPLLGAKGPVIEWLKDHPDSDNPDAALITVLPTANGGEPGEMLDYTSINSRLKKIGREAEINKPVNPHNFRHNFVTIAKRDYELDDAYIKHLIGHSPQSNVMETTYQHLSDNDAIEAAEVGAGMREKEESSTLTPETCEICSANLNDDARVCHKCGNPVTPDAHQVQTKVEEDKYESAKEAESEQEKDDLDTVVEALEDNPEVVEQLADKLADD